MYKPVVIEVLMPNAATYYSHALQKNFSFLGTWPPNARICLGDVGVWKDGVFKPLSSLERLGIPMKTRKGKVAAAFSLVSETTIAVHNQLTAAVDPGLQAAKADVDINFNGHGGFLFQAVDCYQDDLDDKLGLAKNVIGYFRAGEWQKDWAVVDSLIRADSATIAVSNSGKASLGIQVDGPVEVTSLARLKGGFAVHHESGSIARFISQSGLVPLFTLARVKTSFLYSAFGGPNGGVRFGGGGHTPTDVQDQDYFDAVAAEENS
jgi:hypothetical protein